MSDKTKTADVLVENCGTLFTFAPQTERGREWINSNVQAEPYQWLGGHLCVEYRYAADLADGMVRDGLEVA